MTLDTRQTLTGSWDSFADALHWLRHRSGGGPDDTLPTLLCVPHRPGRVEPRAVTASTAER